MTGEIRRSLLDYSFGPQLGSDFQFQITGTGLAPSPVRCIVQLKPTLSVKAFHNFELLNNITTTADFVNPLSAIFQEPRQLQGNKANSLI